MGIEPTSTGVADQCPRPEGPRRGDDIEKREKARATRNRTSERLVYQTRQVDQTVWHGGPNTETRGSAGFEPARARSLQCSAPELRPTRWIRGESNPYRRVASAVLSQLSYRPEETRCHESGSNRRRPGLQPSALPAELSRQRRRPSRVRPATPRRGLEPLSSARQADCDARRITRQITRARRAR